MKKVKHLVFALLATLLSIVTVNAKQMTAKELGEEATKIAPKARFIFVIGKYAYTSTYDKFNIQDVMLASSDSIELDKKGNMKDLVSTMTIYRIDRTYDKNYKPTGWSIGTNEIGNGKALGTTKSQKKIDIRYIDYVPMQEESKFNITYDIDADENSTYKSVLETALCFRKEEAYGDKLELVNGKLTGLLLKDGNISLNPTDKVKYKDAEYYFAYIVKVPNATSKTTVTTTGFYGSSTVGYDKFDVTSSDSTPGMVVLVPVSYEKWQKNKKITVTVDLDGNESEYGPTTQTIDLSGLKFQTKSTAEIGLGKDKATQADKDILKGWGYNETVNKDLTLKDNKLDGTLVEQVLNAQAFGASKEAGYYFDFTFVLPKGTDKNKARIEQVQDESVTKVIKTFKAEEYDESNNLTILYRFSPDTTCTNNKENCKLYFRVDIDGDGKEYLPTIYTIDYSEVTFEKSSIFTVAGLTDEDKFTEENGWYDTNDGYSVEVKVDEQDAKKYNVTGVLPIVDDTNWKDEEFDSSKELYYLGLLLKLMNAPEGFTNDSNAMTVKFLHGTSEDSQFITSEDFNTAKEIYVLKALAETSETKEFTITVDLDGDGEEYAPYTVTIDWSGLKLQKPSTSTISKDNIHEDTQKQLTEWDYEADTNQNVVFTPDTTKNNTTKVTGKLVEQKLNAAAFGADKEAGYYFTFTFVTPEGVDRSKVVVERLKDENGSEVKKAFQNTDIDADGNLTILYRFDVNTPNCDAGNADSCKLYYRVDLDGDEKAYLPTTYVIDYSGLNFEKTSLFTVGAITSNDNKFTGETGWLDTTNGYSVTVKETENDPNKYTITGVLPIINDENWDDDEFNSNEELYYLGLLLKLSNAPDDFDNNDSKMTIKFLHGEDTDTQFITEEDFASAKTLYILKALSEVTTGEEKVFTITVDLDGDGEEYAPYTVTIDWSGLQLQKQTTASVNVAGTSTTVPQTDKTLLDEYGYQFPDEITLSADNSNHNKGTLSYNAETHKLSGTIKEQKLKKGFSQESLDSYFYTYVIKPEVVTDDIRVTITAGDNDVTTYDISDFAVDKNGQKVLTILQHIPLTDKNSPKNLKITIDTDGDSKKGYLVSEEYTIEYDNIDFVDLHTVTVTDNAGATKETTDVYDGEKYAKPTDPEKEKDELDDNQYNKFDHWNQKNEDIDTGDTEFKFADGKSESSITDDVTIYPIWEIDVDQYITDAIKHINEKENVKNNFQIKKIEERERELLVEIINNDAKLSDITETAIASTIAHALASGEIDSINIELGSNSKEFKAEDAEDEAAIKSKVSEALKDFFTKEAAEGETLDDLYKKWQDEEEGLELTIFPKKDVAVIKGAKVEDNQGSGVIYHISVSEDLAVMYDAGSLDNPETDFVKTGQSINELPTPTIPATEKDYRTFDGWYEDGEKVEVADLKGITKNHTLTAHYTLNVEKFVEDVVKDLNAKDSTYSDDFTGKFELDQKENNITINIDGVKVPLTELAETSIPGTIAYILEKGEIQDITLTAGTGNSVTFNKDYTTDAKTYDGTAERDETLLDEAGIALKKEIIEGAKEVFDKELSSNESTATLDQLEYEDKKFTIKIGSADETVKLVDNEGNEVTTDDKKTYTFTFDADFAVVDQDGQIGAKDISTALSSAKNYSTIYIDGDYTLTDTLTLENKNVTIESVEVGTGIKLADTENTKLSVTDKDYVIDVVSGNVTIADLELTGGKKAELKVEDNATATVTNLELGKGSGTLEEGIYVSKTGTLNVTSLTFEGETHDIPAVRGENYHVNPNVSAVNAVVKMSAAVVKKGNYINVVKHEKPWCTDTDKNKSEDDLTSCKKVSYSDEYTSTSDYFYYLDKSHVKNYVMVIFNDSEGGRFLGQTRIYEDGEDVKPLDYLDKDKNVTSEGKQLYFVGWGLVRGDTSSRRYADLYKDWTNVTTNTRFMYFAYYLEHGHEITVNDNGLDELSKYKDKKYYTYKFADKSNGNMKVSELVAVDPDFAELWKTLQEQAASSHNQIMFNSEVATEQTEITANGSFSLAAQIAVPSQAAANVNIKAGSGYEVSGNKVSGLLTTQSNDNRYYIPVTINSDEFVDNKSVITVTNPNNETKEYTYTNNGAVARIAAPKSISLNLEAIKQSNIKTSNGKVYEIGIDYNGDNQEDATYSVDYNELETLEELINNAAKNTANASNLTLTKNNKIKGLSDVYTSMYDKDKYIRVFTKDNVDFEYYFRYKNVVTSHNGPIVLGLRKVKDSATCDYVNNKQVCRPTIKDWEISNTLTEISMGAHEINLLQDVMKNTVLIEALNKVEKVENEEHKFIVTLSKERLDAWLNSTYLDNKENMSRLGAEVDENQTVKFEVVLDSNNEYLVSFKSLSDFTINTGNYKYENNKIDITFSNVGTTDLSDPKTYLSATEEEIINFYEAVKKWHKEYTGAEIYEG